MNVFIAGATGYIGRHLVPELLQRGHSVRALVRRGSEGKLAVSLKRRTSSSPPAAGLRARHSKEDVEVVTGDALDADTYAASLAPSDTFIQLVGVPHPSPAKAEQFRTIDLVAVRESVRAVRGSSIRHFIYLSVPQPAPVMKAYVAVRAEGEQLVRETRLGATFIRPFYVLGPGHWWPYLFLPLFRLWGDQRLYPVRLGDVVRAIVGAVEQPPGGVRIIEAPDLNRGPAALQPTRLAPLG